MVAAVGEFNPGGSFQSPVESFEYEDFRAPTMAEVEATPGYEFRLREGQRALENAAAAQGVTRTGGAMKDLMRFGQDYATGQYGQEYARRLGENQLLNQRGLQANQDAYGRSLGEYQMGYGQRQDVYDARMRRGESEARMAELGAGRNLASQRLQFEANQRQYNDQYRSAMDQYLMGQDRARWQDAREWDREVMYPEGIGNQADSTLYR